MAWMACRRYLSATFICTAIKFKYPMTHPGCGSGGEHLPSSGPGGVSEFTTSLAIMPNCTDWSVSSESMWRIDVLGVSQACADDDRWFSIACGQFLVSYAGIRLTPSKEKDGSTTPSCWSGSRPPVSCPPSSGSSSSSRPRGCVRRRRRTPSLCRTSGNRWHPLARLCTGLGVALRWPFWLSRCRRSYYLNFRQRPTVLESAIPAPPTANRPHRLVPVVRLLRQLQREPPVGRRI